MSTRTILVCDNCKRDAQALPYRIYVTPAEAPVSDWATAYCLPGCGHYAKRFCSQGCALNFAAEDLRQQEPKPTLIERVTGRRKAKAR